MKQIWMLVMIIFIACGMNNIQRKPSYNFDFENKKSNVEILSIEQQLEIALLINDDDECYKRVEELLKEGADPNKVSGQFKWIDTNPLWNVNGDYKLSKLFIDYGADVKKRPYIARLLTYRIIAEENPRGNWVKFYRENPQVKCRTEREVYDCCKLLLESGADPNMKAIEYTKVLWLAKDWYYNRYFNKHGETAINYCIRENYLQVFQLLVEYGAVLNDESLILGEKTTERTGNPTMGNLVKALYDKQLCK